MWFSQNLTMKTSFSLFLLSSALALAACAPMGGSEGGPPPRDEGNTARAAAPGPVAQLQTQLQETADALKLTPKQAVLWDVYQERVGALMADQMKQSAHSASQRQKNNRGQTTVYTKLLASQPPLTPCPAAPAFLCQIPRCT